MGNVVHRGVRPKTASEMAHVKLKRIYEERIGNRMSQAEFGRRYGIGSQCGVALYLNGGKPLGIEAAAKFAAGLGCTVGDFAPELETRFLENVVPFLGKKLRRAALIALSIPALSSLAPRDAQADGAYWTNIQQNQGGLCIMLNRLLRWFSALSVFRRLQELIAASCDFPRRANRMPGLALLRGYEVRGS